MSNIELFGSDKVKNLVTDTLYGCDDGELFIEDNVSESFLFDDGVLKNTSFNEHKGFGLRGVKEDLIGYSHSSEFSINALNFQTTSALLSKLIYQLFIFVLWHGFLH